MHSKIGAIFSGSSWYLHYILLLKDYLPQKFNFVIGIYTHFLAKVAICCILENAVFLEHSTEKASNHLIRAGEGRGHLSDFMKTRTASAVPRRSLRTAHACCASFHEVR